jgi:hypothetical protein
MKEQTITQNMSLFHARRRIRFELATRFYEAQLRELRRDARKKRRQILWLKFRQLWHRHLACGAGRASRLARN